MQYKKNQAKQNKNQLIEKQIYHYGQKKAPAEPAEATEILELTYLTIKTWRKICSGDLTEST